MTALTLISFPTCPFVQRAIIALKEKEVPFDVLYVDLANKPDWFLAISPLGKVPLLKVERPGETDAVIFESAVILEFLEETTGSPHLHPADPLQRAQHRSWIEYGSTLLGDLWRLGTASNDAELDAAKEALKVKFTRLESTLTDGPYFAGGEFSYVDAVFAPAFRQIDALETVAKTGLLVGFPKVSAWRLALASRPSVIAAVPTDFVELYLNRLRDQNARILALAA